MRIVFLDQNHWVSLARAAREPEAYPAEYDVLTRLGRAVEAGETIVPLSATHLHETYKIGDPRRRHDMAYTQATLSGGQVLCCRAALLHAQVTDVLRDAHGLPPIQRPERWFLSNVFIEASVELDHPSLDGKPSPKLLAAMRRHPAEFLYDYLMSADETTRLTAVSMFSAGIAELRQRIEDRRDRWREQSLAIRRRAYGATLIIDDMDRLVQIARKAGVEIAQVTDLGPALCKRLVRDVPLYNVERELSVRLEAVAGERLPGHAGLLRRRHLRRCCRWRKSVRQSGAAGAPRRNLQNPVGNAARRPGLAIYLGQLASRKHRVAHERTFPTEAMSHHRALLT